MNGVIPFEIAVTDTPVVAVLGCGDSGAYSVFTGLDQGPFHRPAIFDDFLLQGISLLVARPHFSDHGRVRGVLLDLKDSFLALSDSHTGGYVCFVAADIHALRHGGCLRRNGSDDEDAGADARDGSREHPQPASHRPGYL